jgi:hypothetical protein
MSDPRLAINLRTGSGENEYYDQIMGMSQGIINASFEKLYEKYEGLQKIDIVIRDGSIKGEMNPPKIAIPAHENKLDQSKVYHHLRSAILFLSLLCFFTVRLVTSNALLSPNWG